RRGLCLLDPYGLQLDWKVIEAAGKMRTIDMFLNFPVADMNRNVLWRDPEGVDAADLKRMTEFWGDDSWRQIAYTTKRDLFGHLEKEENKVVAEGFRQRLLKVARLQACARAVADAEHEGSNGVLSVLRFTQAR